MLSTDLTATHWYGLLGVAIVEKEIGDTELLQVADPAGSMA